MPTTPNFSQPAIFSEVATPTAPDSGYLKVYANSGVLCSIANSGTEQSYLTSSSAAATYQPLDSDLTSIASTGVDSYGIGLLTKTSGSGVRDYIGAGTSSFDGAYGSLSGVPSTFAPSAHTHGNITNAGAIGSTTGLPIVTTTSGVLTAGSFGTTAGTFAAGDDSRITGALSTSTAAATYAVIAAGQPISGTVGQVLAKNSGANYDSSWSSLVLGDRYLSTSTTSNTLSNTVKSFTIATGLAYTPTQNITIAYDAAHHMHGEVVTYDSGTGALSVDVKNHTGAGTYTSWVVNVGGVTPVTVVSWGDIIGTLGTQSDLSDALNVKLEITTAASTYVPLTRTLNTLALSADQTFAVGTTGTDFTIASSGTAHTFNIPSASATARGLVTTGTQTIAGQKTFTSSVLILGGQTNASSIDNSSSGLIIMAPANGAQSSGMAIGSAGTSVYSLHTGDTNSGTADCFFLSSGSPSSVITNKQGTSSVVSLTNGGLKLSSGSSVRWGASHAGRDALSASDLFISRDAAGTLAQRNGTTAQTFRLYNTYTSSTSFETLQIQNVASTGTRIGYAIGSAGGTGGAARQLDFGRWNAAGAWTSLLTWDTNDFAIFMSNVQISDTSGYSAFRHLNTCFASLGDGSGFTIASNGYQASPSSSGWLTRTGQQANSSRFASIFSATHTLAASTSYYDWRFSTPGSTSSTSFMRLAFDGTFQLIQPVSTSGSPTAFTLTGAAHTTLTLSTEATDVNFNLARTVQFATGALTTQRAMRIQAPTYGFVGASTITTASTLSISGPPVAGTNATITNAYALNVESGAVNIGSGSLSSTLGAGTTVFKASTSVAAGLVLGVDSSGRCAVEVTGFNTGSNIGGAYFTANGFQESWFNVITGSNTSGSRVMRFGNLANRFSIQLLNDAMNSITSTPFSIANTSPSNSFYMSASGGVALGGTTDLGAGGLYIVGAISGTSHTLEQRNSTNAQTFSLYNTYTSPTSYERLNIKGKASANFEIGPENGESGGTLRGLTIGGYTDGSATIMPWLTFDKDGNATFTTAIIASNISGNLSGSNSGDQDLSEYLTIDDAATTYVPLTRTLNTLALSADQTFAVGTTGTDFAIESSDTAHTFNIPDASDTARGLITTDTQTIAGAKTFSGPIASANGIYFTSEPTGTPSGTTQTLTLADGNHQTLALTSATGTVTATLTVPTGSSAGSIIVKQHASAAKDIVWAVSAGTIKWMGAEPDWVADAAGSVRIVSWRYDGSFMYLGSTDVAV